MQQCLFCGHKVQLVHVHGHYQCPTCFTNALPCCDGDNCHTNQYFDTKIHAIENNSTVPVPHSQRPQVKQKD